MKYDFIIFGGTGTQGRICARDLLESGYKVLLVGRDKSKIGDLIRNKNASFMEVDLRNQESITNSIIKSGAEVVVNCAELVFNLDIMKACLKTKKSLTDLGGLQEMTKKQFKLHDSFRKAGITSIIGCGSTPGIVNVMVRHAVDKLDMVESINLGFAWDSNIKKFVVPYSMPSIFYELTNDPITLHDGKFVREKRMACKGVLNFREIGKQMVYCIVHSEVYTFSRYFKDKGLKTVHYMAGFPEHSMKVIQTLINLGFGSEKAVKINGKIIKPINFINEILKQLPFPRGYKETENIWAEVYGTKNGGKKKMIMECIVKTTKGWEKAGSNIDTGRTISIISQMIKEGIINESGVFSPEKVVPVELFFRKLRKRNMLVYENGKVIN